MEQDSLMGIGAATTVETAQRRFASSWHTIMEA
jgi:hypothetical protein